MRFPLGYLVATAGVADCMRKNPEFGEFISSCMKRYVSCDWGELCKEDKSQNDYAVKVNDCRILASYDNPTNEDWKIWIITEWDRSVTTVLFPSEY